ncbi:potassium transporter Kef [Microbacterium lushaniae]|nr:potassium transporter Kef [Microbacterium lushaniae]KAA9157031.1 potassium transporter Kef [Microbacterium lushaniae]
MGGAPEVNRLPGHLADQSLPSGAPEPVAGVDWTVAERNVRRAGGDPARFAACIAGALRAAGGTDDLVALAGIAAWRSGALAYRDDALARIGTLGAGGREGAAAALGLEPGELDEFAERQMTDRFWWPGRASASGYVCAVGGFAGLGGAWVAPPVSGVALSTPGAFAIRAGDEWWRLDADVWGSQLSWLDAEPDDVAQAGSASIVCLPDSYLAWVHVRGAA